MDTTLNFCTRCATPLTVRIPDDDDRERHLCEACGFIHYQNPRIVVCAIPAFEHKVLLCRRAIEPQHGLWTLPGGFMENGESSLDTAIRETVEEACARITLQGLYSLYNVTHVNQVHLFFRASLLDLDFAPGRESLEVALFAEHEVPWDRIAFTAVAGTLRQYFADLPSGQFPLRLADVLLDDNNARSIRHHTAMQAGNPS